MDMPQNEIERLLFFEHVRKTAEAVYAKDPSNVENLTQWGSALLEMSSFFPAAEAKTIIQDAMLKLEEALKVNPKKCVTLCYLGNAYSSFGLLTPDAKEARSYFNKATDYLTTACEEEPDNELYRKSLAMAAKAPEFHAEFQLQQAAAGATAAAKAASTGPSSAKSARKKKNSDLKYDMMGWVILAVGIVAIAVYTQNHMPPPPSR